MHCRIKFTKKSIQELQKTQENARLVGNLKWVERCTALLMLGHLLTQEKTAQLLGYHVRTIQRWVVLFLALGAKGLKPEKSPGRPSRLTKTQKKELYDQIIAGPEECGYHTGIWTCAIIQEHIQKQFGVAYSVFYINQLLRNLGLSHIKPKFCYSASKPEDVEKQLKWIRKRFPEIVRKVEEKGGVLLFQDESSFQLQSNIIRSWYAKGDPGVVEISAAKGKIHVIGAIEFRTGRLHYTIQRKGKLTNQVFATFLKKIVNAYKGKHVTMIIDGASYHGGPYVRKVKEKYKNLELIRQPARSPQLNPIEKLWKEVKRLWSGNKYFRSIQDLLNSVKQGLTKYRQNRDMVLSLMNKWHELILDSEGLEAGEYDTSFVPKKYHHLIKKTLKNMKQPFHN